jgi:hypothetical protein
LLLQTRTYINKQNVDPCQRQRDIKYSNHHNSIIITMLILELTIVQQTYYEMTATDKQPLISESVTVTQIDIHPIGEEPNQHVIRATPEVSRMTTVRKSLLSQTWARAPEMKSCPPPGSSGPTVVVVASFFLQLTTLKQGGVTQQNSYKSY